MPRTRILSVCIALLALPFVVSAADDKLFDKLDSNKDGSISREEFISCPLVRSKDASGKDRIQHKDLCAKPGAALSVQDKQRLFDKVDTDRSNNINRKEFYKFATPDGFAPIRF